MTRTRGIYKRLPGRRILSLGVVHKLFAGPDHLLLLASTSFSETYKRFYYRDIQAIVTRRTRRGAAWNAALGATAALFLLPAATGGSRPNGLTIFFWTCGLFFLLLLLVNALRGPTCAAHLRTAVHLVELPTLGRLRSVRKTTALVRPRIVEAQGLLAPEAVPLAASEIPSDAPRPVPPPVPAAPVREAGRVHELLFYSLLADGVYSIVAFQVRSPWVILLSVPVFIGVTASLIAAMIRQRQKAVPSILRKTLWAAVGYWSCNVVLAYVLSVAAAMRNPDAARNQWEFIKYLASIRPTESPAMLSAHLFGIVCPLALGLFGLAALLRCGSREGRRGTRTAPAVF